jgi:hypothetical protein
MDRISKIVVEFSNGKGQTVTQTFEMDPQTTFIKSQNPQGKVPGHVQVHGNFTKALLKTSRS